MLKSAAVHKIVFSKLGLLVAAILLSSFSAAAADDLGAAASPPTVPKPAIVSREEWGSKAQPISEEGKQIAEWITIHHAGELWHDKDDAAEFVRHMQIWGQKRPQLEKLPRAEFAPQTYRSLEPKFEN